MKQYTNLEIATLFRKVAAAYQILNENRFKIIAYERVADSIEHLTSEVKDLWDDKKLSEIPGAGETIIGYLDELFRTGKVKHFDAVMHKVPAPVFPLLSIPGIGPKKAYKLVSELKLKNEKSVIEDIGKAIRIHKIAPIEGFGEKSEEDIAQNIEIYKKGAVKEKRILLSEADAIADDLITYLKKHKNIQRVDVLGSLRRFVSTIGDIDIAIITDKPDIAIEYFCAYPHTKIIEKGPTGASLLLHNGRQVDLRVQDKETFGAMLQYFTGSKNHNITLRTYALTKGMSLSEYGIKKIRKKDTILKFDTEEKFYDYLGLEWIPPELREDKGEIQVALTHSLPKLVNISDIRGDLHLHTNFDLEPSHDLGAHTIEEMLEKADALGYDYIGISDHNPSIGNHTEDQIIAIMQKRKEFYRNHVTAWNEKHHKNIHVFTLLEVDIKPDGTLALPNRAFPYVDAIIASIHSSFTLDKKEMTERIKRALVANPKVKIFGHPTGRLLLKREGYEADWNEIFALCKEYHIALEINASPYRLDLTDALVYDALKRSCKFCINSDAHSIDDMKMMKYGVSVARRGWLKKDDIINTFEYNEIKKWLMP